jgi:hypothetical protein
MLAEYSALRAEIEGRITLQWNVVALQITSAGAIYSLAVSAVSSLVLLLIIPLSSFMLGSRYILHDFHIKLIEQYIRDSLSPRLSGGLEWEQWKKENFSDVKDRRWFYATGWNVTHPTRLAFEGVAALALIVSAACGMYSWQTVRSHGALAFGIVLLWTLGAAVTCALHRSFEESSSSTPATF